MDAKEIHFSPSFSIKNYNCPRPVSYPHRGNFHYHKKKFRWRDENGRQLTAGGILPYDDTGVWVIGEKKRDGAIEWTDPGGKYNPEDCDIYTTCAREFGEELYYSSSISRETILDIAKNHKPIYVNGHRNLPVYICYVVHTETLQSHGTNLSPERFMDARAKTLKSNSMVPEHIYSSLILYHMDFGEVSDLIKPSATSNLSDISPYPNAKLSYRLTRILNHSSLREKIYN